MDAFAIASISIDQTERTLHGAFRFKVCNGISTSLQDRFALQCHIAQVIYLTSSGACPQAGSCNITPQTKYCSAIHLINL